MNQVPPAEPSPALPDGVRLVRIDGPEPIELTIRAADADELAWRIHDLVPLIQSGRFQRLVARAPSKP